MDALAQLLIVSPLSDGKTWVLMQAFSFESIRPDHSVEPFVQVGFQTDFASIPRPFWIFLPKWGKYGGAAVVHDWLYWTQPPSVNRKLADDTLLKGMGQLKVPGWQRLAIYLAVRAFGGLAWARNAEERRAGDDRVLAVLPSNHELVADRRAQFTTLAQACIRRIREAGVAASMKLPPSS